jgi:hypothetical protein
MQLLASALPGFRDLRAPLTAGYLWLLLLWIWLRPDLAIRPSNEIAGAVYDLGKAVGPIWVGLGVSLAAYLIGSVSQSLSPALEEAISRVWRASFVPLLRLGPKIKWLPMQFTTLPQLPTAKYWDQAVEVTAKLNIPEGADSDAEQQAYKDAEALIRYESDVASDQLDRDISLPATLLLGQQPQLFTEADRLKAESQFRLAVVPPLTAITIAASLSQSPWWLVGLLPVFILLWQGNTRNREYRVLMYGAIERGIVKSDAFDRFRMLAGEEPIDRPPDANEKAQ